MKTTNHTPGPWSIEWNHQSNTPEFIRAFVDGEMQDIVEMSGEGKDSETLANAHLIAAAPKLLQVLKDLLPEFVDLYERFDPTGEIAVWDQWTQEALEVIAEAEGVK